MQDEDTTRRAITPGGWSRFMSSPPEDVVETVTLFYLFLYVWSRWISSCERMDGWKGWLGDGGMDDVGFLVRLTPFTDHYSISFLSSPFPSHFFFLSLCLASPHPVPPRLAPACTSWSTFLASPGPEWEEGRPSVPCQDNVIISSLIFSTCWGKIPFHVQKFTFIHTYIYTYIRTYTYFSS